MAKNIIGEEIDNYVANQIKVRQQAHGSGVQNLRKDTNFGPATKSDLTYLNSKTSWVKLASGVAVTGSKLQDINLPTSLSGMELAKNNILFGGNSQIGPSVGLNGTLIPSSNTIYSGYDYSKDWGIVPMPGIESMDIKTLNRGSIEKATIKLKAYSKEQFNIIDLLYLRLGYTVLLEWGNSHYLDHMGKVRPILGTLTENTFEFFGASEKDSYRSIIGPINKYRSDYQANYDALLGKISNFNWSFNPDGSYDITITIISMGDVIESLKSDLSPSVEISSFVDQLNSVYQASGQSDASWFSSGKVDNELSAMLFLWKFVNKDILSSYRSSHVTIGGNKVGKICTSGVGTISAKIYSFYIHIGTFDESSNNTYFLFEKETTESDAESIKKEIEDLVKVDNYQTRFITDYAGDEFDPNEIPQKFKSSNTQNEIFSLGEVQNVVQATSPVKVKVKREDINIADNPLKKSASTKSCFVLRGDGSSEDSPDHYYLRFGTLLRHIQRTIVPSIITQGDKKVPLFTIEYTDVFNNKMYTLPNQISLDPRVCLVKNKYFQKIDDQEQILPELKTFKHSDFKSGKDSNVAYIFNIYLNFDFIISSINANKDERGNVGLFGLLSSICIGLNKALGGINNLEPIIDKNTNKIKIIDSTPVPGQTQKNGDYQIELYGYNPDLSKGSNFVRDINLQTAITPEYATMITIGATAGGYSKGMDATAFSNWNKGLKDRFNDEIKNNLEKASGGSVPEAVVNYGQKFLKQFSKCYGFTYTGPGYDNILGLKFEDSAIDLNISIVSEFYRYLQSKNKVGNSVGFIPFKLSLTLDGISGIKIYNKLHIDTRFLPSNYGDSLDLIVTGLSHKLSNNDWETEVQTTVIPFSEGSILDLSSVDIEEAIKQSKIDVKQGENYSPSTTVVTGGWSWTQPGTRALNIASGPVLQGYDLAPHHDSSPDLYLPDDRQKFGFWTRRKWSSATHEGKLMIVGDASANRVENGRRTWTPWIPSPLAGTVTFAGVYNDGCSAIHIKSTSTGATYRFLHGSNLQFSTGDTIKAGDYMYRQGDIGSPGAIHVHYEFPDDKVWLINEWIKKMITNDPQYNHSTS